MKTFRRILVGSTLLVLASAIGSASPLTATVTCTSAEGNTELSSSNNGTILCGGAGVFNLPNGDSLSSIVITLSGGVDSAGSSITLTNTTAQQQTGHGTTDVGYNLDALTMLPGFTYSTSIDANLADPFIFDVLAGTGNQILQPNVPFTKAVGGTATGTLTNISNFNPYVGQTFNITVDTETGLGSGITGGGGTVAQSTEASITASVVYTYAPTGTPEPTTLFLMGTALVGVGLLRKRMKA